MIPSVVMLRLWSSPPLVLALALAPACSDVPATGATEIGTTDDGTSTGTGTTTTTDAPTTGAATTGAATTGATSTTTGDEEPALVYAHGLRLTRVTINQGVQMEIVRDGLEVPAEEWPVRLLAGRKAVIRADWSLHAEFVPRPITGRLTVWTAGGDKHVDEFTTTVDGPSSDGDLFSTFSWELPAALMRPGLQYRIEAIEPDPALASGEVSDPPPLLPLPGRGQLHVEAAPMEIKLLLVPIQHEYGGMTCTPTITDADVTAMRVWVEQHNPVERAVVTVREPMVYTASIGTSQDGFVPLLNALAELRAADRPPPNLYYYGLIQSCDGYPTGLLGQAAGIPGQPTKSNAYQRHAVGRYQGSGTGARDTLVHELGHTQGLYHVRCTGGEAGADPDYPHANGRIGVWGYGIHDTTMRSPTGFRDYMSYCLHTWVSDFGWEKTFDTIAALTSWDAGGASEEAEALGVPIVVGTLRASGSTHWYTTIGAVPTEGRAEGTVVEFATAEGPVTMPASVLPIPDSDALSVVAALPEGAFSELTLRTGSKVRARVSAAQVALLH